MREGTREVNATTAAMMIEQGAAMILPPLPILAWSGAERCDRSRGLSLPSTGLHAARLSLNTETDKVGAAADMAAVCVRVAVAARSAPCQNHTMWCFHDSLPRSSWKTSTTQN